MYIRRIEIENVRSIERLEWEVPGGQFSGWNVVLGDNGAGKSSFLRAVAIALVGANNAGKLWQDGRAWLRSGTESGHITLNCQMDHHFDSNPSIDEMNVALKRHGDGFVSMESWDRHWPTVEGWFSAAYGPFRRFSGGDKDIERALEPFPRLFAHLSVFSENIALGSALEWLQNLKFKLLEELPEGDLLGRLKNLINQPGFLPHNVRLKDATSRGVTFEDGNAFPVPVEELSDGYRAILSMTFELIRQLNNAFGPDRIFSADDLHIVVPGVVLIDEVDAHLHPSWQKRIGFWLTKLFPRIQFIVTTHSPLVCQAAENGTVFLLPRPGTRESGEMMTGTLLNRLLYGNILDAYSTEAFGTAETRSERGNEMQERLAQLNVKEIRKGLTDEELSEQAELRSSLPTADVLSR